MSSADVDVDTFRAEARAWLAEHLPERRGGARRDAHETTSEELAADRARQRALYDAGFVGITVPTTYGGRGLSPAHQRAFDQEAARYDLPAPGGIASHVTLGIVLPTLLAHASEEQKRDWVPKILRGDELWVQLLSEPGAGSDLAGVLTRAERDGDTWVLTGTKVWSSGALHADVGICLARTNWDVPKHKGLTWFKVPLRDPAVTVRPVREINGGAEFCEEFLDGVAVGTDAVIGDVDAGWPIANTMLAFERGAAGGSTGTAPGADGRRRLAPDLVALAEGAGRAGDGAVRQLVAEGHIADLLQGLLAKRVVERMLAGEADPSSASLIKLGYGLVNPARARLAMEVAGAAGVAWAPGSEDDTAALAFLNGRIMSIAGGSNQIQRNIISERLLGLPREPSVDGDRAFRDVLRDAKEWGRRSGS